jgi:hypothetical protein
MTAMRSVIVLSVATLGVGLALHLAGAAAGDRIIAAGLLVLVAMPVVNVLIVLGREVRRRHWGFVLATLGVMAALAYAIWQ